MSIQTERDTSLDSVGFRCSRSEPLGVHRSRAAGEEQRRKIFRLPRFKEVCTGLREQPEFEYRTAALLLPHNPGLCELAKGQSTPTASRSSPLRTLVPRTGALPSRVGSDVQGRLGTVRWEVSELPTPPASHFPPHPHAAHSSGYLFSRAGAFGLPHGLPRAQKSPYCTRDCPPDARILGAHPVLIEVEERGQGLV